MVVITWSVTFLKKKKSKYVKHCQFKNNVIIKKNKVKKINKNNVRIGRNWDVNRGKGRKVSKLVIFVLYIGEFENTIQHCLIKNQKLKYIMKIFQTFDMS